MIAALIMTWCLLGVCEDVRAPVRLSMGDCTIFGQHYASDWQRENPAYADHRLHGWRCEMGERA